MDTNSETNNIIIPYSATAISLFARFIFMYLLYTKKSTNNYSLIFCLLNMCSSSLWIKYCFANDNQPLLVRSMTDLVLFTISSMYIVRNKINEKNSIHSEVENTVLMGTIMYSDFTNLHNIHNSVNNIHNV